MRTKEIDELPYMLNANEVADILGIARNSAYNLMRSKGFPTIHIGRRMVVPKDKLIKWIENQ
ncbi:MAG: helix-turn-helix domain-containing protein [Oscillospiraceae bacterium]|nr:helix-turn-helix domain-containing protein [Oscillospiraceae bacterium]